MRSTNTPRPKSGLSPPLAKSRIHLVQFTSGLFMRRTIIPITSNEPAPSPSATVAGSAQFLAPENLSLDSSTARAFWASVYLVGIRSVWHLMTEDNSHHKTNIRRNSQTQQIRMRCACGALSLAFARFTRCVLGFATF